MLVGGRGRHALKEYIYSIASFSFALGLVLVIAPDGVRQGIKKHVKFIGALCLICILIDPVAELIGTLHNLSNKDLSGFIGESDKGELYDKYENIYESYLDGSYGENVGAAVKDSLLKKFGIKKDNCRVLTEFCNGDGDEARKPQKITIILSGDDKFRDPDKIKSFISDTFDCEAAVAVE